MGRNHLGSFIRNPNFRVVGVCDVDTNRRQAAVNDVVASNAKSGVTAAPKAVADFRELLSDPSVDAVLIATPDHWHAFIAIAAAKAGKDIYCEKPLTQSIEEARALVNAVRAADRVFQTGSQQRSSREFRVACELVRNGVIGTVSSVEAGFGGPGKWCDLGEEPAEPGLDWDLWLGPCPSRPYHSILSPRGVHNHFPAWRNFREYGGGMVTDWGAHHLDITQWGLGMDHAGPVEVIPASEAKTATSGGRLLYTGGVEVRHTAENGVKFIGSRGVVYVNRGAFSFERDGKTIAAFSRKESERPLTAQLDAVEKEYLADAKIRLVVSSDHRTDWLNAIRSRTRPICDVEVGARSVTACHLLGFSYYYGEKFSWDPENNRFAAGTGKAEWLTRSYRGDWKLA
jgi:predicted dehydrogenase